jgi:hypothetical protein
MAKKTGYIEWWKTKAYFYIHVLHTNGNINSPDKYPSRSGIYHRKKVLEKMYPGYKWRKNPLKK